MSSFYVEFQCWVLMPSFNVKFQCQVLMSGFDDKFQWRGSISSFDVDVDVDLDVMSSFDVKYYLLVILWLLLFQTVKSILPITRIGYDTT